MTTPEIVRDPSALMTIVAAARHPDYATVVSKVGSEVSFLRPVIEMALEVDNWLNHLVQRNEDTFNLRPFAPEYVVLEALGGWIIEQLIDMDKAGVDLCDIGNDVDLPFSLSDALDFAREAITKETGFKFAGHDEPVFIEPELEE